MALKPLSLMPDLVEQVYQAILHVVCDGSLAPGKRITQESLAERFQVSRQPVLQAMLLLKRDGLIVDAGAKGVMVAPLTTAHIGHLYEVRAVLDGLAAHSAALHRADIPYRLLVAGRKAAKDCDILAMIDADLAFHRAVYAAAGNPLLMQSAEHHWNHIRRVMGAVLQKSATWTAVWDEHEAIVAAIAGGEPETAQQRALRHCEAASADLASHLPEDLPQGVPRHAIKPGEEHDIH